MSSAFKTLGLLEYFSTSRAEIGLSQFCRLAGRDKATTYRYLQTLEKTGFIEQNPDNKRYRLGPIVLQLAHTREATVPRKAAAREPLCVLAKATGETAHVSVLSGVTVYPLDACESDEHSTRVFIDQQRFPLHATASGICALAFGPPELIEAAQGQLDGYTPTTITTLPALEAERDKVRGHGIAKSAGSFEADAHSLAAPLFDASGFFAGSISVASVATRFTPDLERHITSHLIAASRQITRNWGGTVPASLERAWDQALSPSSQQDIAS